MGLVQRFRTELNYIKDKKELVETLKELDKYMDGNVETDKEFKKMSKRAGFCKVKFILKKLPVISVIYP